MIKVKFFASLRELIGKDSAFVEPQAGLTLEHVWQLTANKISLPNNTLCSINLEYAALDCIVSDHDEVAFFPPVTGG